MNYVLIFTLVIGFAWAQNTGLQTDSSKSKKVKISCGKCTNALAVPSAPSSGNASTGTKAGKQ